MLAVISLRAASASSCFSANCRLCSPAFCFKSSTSALASVSFDTPAYQERVNNKLNRLILTSLKPSARALVENIGSRSWQYGASAARSFKKWPRGNIPQYGSSKDRLVKISTTSNLAAANEGTAVPVLCVQRVDKDIHSKDRCLKNHPEVWFIQWITLPTFERPGTVILRYQITDMMACHDKDILQIKDKVCRLWLV